MKKVIKGRAEVDEFARCNIADFPHTHVRSCANCGGDPNVYDRGVNGSGPYRIQCERCGMRTPESTNFAVPLDTWNARR